MSDDRVHLENRIEGLSVAELISNMCDPADVASCRKGKVGTTGLYRLLKTETKHPSDSLHRCQFLREFGSAYPKIVERAKTFTHDFLALVDASFERADVLIVHRVL